MLRRHGHARLQVRGDRSAPAPRRGVRPRRNLTCCRRGPLQALRRVCEQAQRDPRPARGRGRLRRESGVFRPAVPQGRPHFRHRRDQEPRALFRPACGALGKRDFGSVAAWRTDLQATGMAARGWAWTAFDWDEGRLFNYVGDAQNTFPVWNATPLVALDVYEHAYFLDYQTDRASYIAAFFDNLDWDVVNGWVAQYGIPTA
ncbi:MAG: hypothetical protein E6F98_13490 [Actinobacteria bacterium]|nr:MAG: hypothetical protein E6F98_13490 [Actinomycetota bacterium]